MREIKFRAWDIDCEQMVKDDDIYFIIMQDGSICRSGSHPDNCGEWCWHVDDNPTDNLIIMQFTGLCDKTGKEIYEGDIGILGDYTCVLEYSVREGKFWWIDIVTKQWITGRPSDAKIIGNIYDNPELLEMKND